MHVSTTHATPTTLSRTQRAAIYGAVFLSFIDNFALLPVIGPRAQQLGGTPLLVGFAIAAYSLANLAFDPIGGALADRFGRRRVVMVSLIISPAAIAIYALADSLPLFLLARLIHGASGGALAAALFALLGDAAPVGRRGRTLGRAGALIGIAAVVGPASAAIISAVAGATMVFLGVAVLIAVGLLIVLPLLPETLAPRASAAATPGAWRRILADPQLRIALVAIFGLEAAVGSVTGFIKDGLITRALAEGRDQAGALRYAAGASGGLFTIFGVIAIAIMLSRVADRVDRRGPFGISLVGLGALAGALTLLAVSPTLTVDLIAMVLYGVGYGLIFPAAAGAVAIASAPGERGRANGALNLSFDIGISAGPILGGLLATLFVGLTAFAGGLTLVVVAAILLPVVGRGSRGSSGAA
jgi:DHA1 family multidrug resistance protein-like MFS transporter